MSWDISNRQILIETVRSAALYLAIAAPVFLLTVWALSFFPGLPRLWHSVFVGASAMLVIGLWQYAKRCLRRRAQR